MLRPRIMVVTAERGDTAAGRDRCRAPARPAQGAKVVFVTRLADGRTELVLELVSGMGRGLTAAPGSVPQVGERLTYTTLSDAFMPSPALPEPDRTPWTHGGPPADREPARFSAGHHLEEVPQRLLQPGHARPGDHPDADRAGQAGNAAHPADHHHPGERVGLVQRHGEGRQVRAALTHDRRTERDRAAAFVVGVAGEHDHPVP